MTDHNKPSSLISVGCETVSACGSPTPPTGTWGRTFHGRVLDDTTPLR